MVSISPIGVNVIVYTCLCGSSVMSRKPVQGLLDLLKYRLDGASLVKVVMWVTITGQAGEQNGNFRLPGYLLPKSRKGENEEKKKCMLKF